MKKQPWIKNPLFDSVFFLTPLLLPVIFLLAFPSFFKNQEDDISTISWIILVLLIDVAHVYSTIFRTYLNPRSRKKIRTKLVFIPLLCWFAGVMLYSLNPLYFWRCLAYVAVFHFVRQQYGFMRIYSRQQKESDFIRRLQGFAIYSATIAPILIWHFSGPKKFNWFVAGDFFYADSPIMVYIITLLLFSSVTVYVLSEIYLFIRLRYFNIPRFLLVIGTAGSWYVGIVLYDGDLSFTALNVIAHGIPYMALVWQSEKKEDQTHNGLLKYIFSRFGVLLFVAIIVTLAYLEEGLWDSLVWREHETFFQGFYIFGHVTHFGILSFLIPLLALPQLVHYVLDAFIWKMRPDQKGVLFISESTATKTQN
jgi:hypothetical protein